MSKSIIMFKNEIEVELHYLTEQEAYGPILNALFEMENDQNIISILFITGKGSGAMKTVLENVLEENSYEWFFENNNTGAYRVYRKNRDEDFFS
ncbi:DNA mismatch repair protein MutS [Mycoplasma iguanae]|uniref:DNA mismatch repair protein MutS n=1 Tax=Mycoplasma iguanae TaxID=292461 RepID=A0ABY5RBJ0_9MOLU|nr:DNA mismatch repair protein MutS [Mycoplasma iguanae]UVD81580.1 DNA mismatch repair protein MutS [Mycoplasma iguanae]